MLNIYVGNLPYETTEDDLVQLFGQYGAIQKTGIIQDRETGRSRGFGFVEMTNDEEARKAIEELNGRDYGGRHLTVNEARPREARGPGGGGYGGGGGGRGRGGFGGGGGGRDGGSDGGSGGGDGGYRAGR